MRCARPWRTPDTRSPASADRRSAAKQKSRCPICTGICSFMKEQWAFTCPAPRPARSGCGASLQSRRGRCPAEHFGRPPASRRSAAAAPRSGRCFRCTRCAGALPARGCAVAGAAHDGLERARARGSARDVEAAALVVLLRRHRWSLSPRHPRQGKQLYGCACQGEDGGI